MNKTEVFIWLLVIGFNLFGLVWAIIDSIKCYHRSGKRWYLVFTIGFALLASIFIYGIITVLK